MSLYCYYELTSDPLFFRSGKSGFRAFGDLGMARSWLALTLLLLILIVALARGAIAAEMGAWLAAFISESGVFSACVNSDL